MDDRLSILEAIERGDISVDEALRQLGAPAPEAVKPELPRRVPTPVARPFLVRVIWQTAFWSGVALLSIGGLLVTGVHEWSIPSGWQILGWVLFVLGAISLALGWWMRGARWLSIRVHEEKRTKISLAFPVPLGLLYWAARLARPVVPQLRDTPVDELVLALHETLRDEEPVVVDVHDDEDGDHVQVFLA
jgi:hypothetical protein